MDNNWLVKRIEERDEFLSDGETISPESKEAAIYRRMLLEHEKDLRSEYDRRWYEGWWNSKNFAWKLMNSDKAPGSAGMEDQLRALVAAGVKSFEPTARFFAAHASKQRGGTAEDLAGSEGLIAVDADIQESQRKRVEKFINEGKEIARGGQGKDPNA